MSEFGESPSPDDPSRNGERIKPALKEIPGLLDAREAGGKYSKDCTLILTEGNSAQTLIWTSLDRDYYGIFALNGKPLNVLKATKQTLEENEQLSYIKEIIGLEDGKDYKSTDDLRYGHILLMTDQGLGAMTYEEGKEVLANKEKLLKEFLLLEEEDKKVIEVASGKKEKDRKTWMLNNEFDDCHLDINAKHIKYKDFFNSDFRQYCLVNCRRSIPSIVDGLKPAQRKIIWCSLGIDFTEAMTVTALAHQVATETAYRHKESNLYAPIIGFAQDYVGSNNIKLFQPIGVFGTRLKGGKDHGEPRYLNTRLLPIARLIFPQDDDEILPEYDGNEEESVEPKWLLPIIPMILVNGCDGGIGTGYSCNIPKFDPLQLIAMLKKKFYNGSYGDLEPWYKGFKGKIDSEIVDDQNVWYSHGVYDQEDDGEYVITELPIGEWTENYENWLRDKDGKLSNNVYITELKSLGDERKIDIRISTISSKRLKTSADGDDESSIEDMFNLKKKLDTKHMNLFDQSGQITYYETADDIFEAYYAIRLPYYGERKKKMLHKLDDEISMLSNKIKLIELVRGNTIDMCADRTASEREEMLTSHGFARLPDFKYLESMSGLCSFTAEALKELETKLKELEDKKNTLTTMTREKLWEEDLDALEKYIQNFSLVEEMGPGAM
ncbi:hypothetical protein Tsubulata_029706 [Turnera subulata]|uniref:DNA topoisomerase (ATP-hydrolyzing) n=1 Tax=Turnera subulata TaxID=218843 RepID=A0A9Q0G3L0_9ROSI|nr:hypothetical protein Tsubulata_029706 [Turnera subulata]